MIRGAFLSLDFRSIASRPDDRVAVVQHVGGHTQDLAQVEVGVVQSDIWLLPG